MAKQTWEQADIAAKKAVPEGLWVQCRKCGATIFGKTLEASLEVCPKCDHHHRVTAQSSHPADSSTRRVSRPLNADLTASDPLGFVDVKPYRSRIEAARRKSGENDGCLTGVGFVKGRKVVLAAMDFAFLGGSMGSVVGEKLARAAEHAIDHDLPLVIVSCSGGARMQESGYSLMQMAKTSAVLARFDEAGGLFISVLADPTTGGVTASFAMLGDVILAEPKKR